MDDSGENQALLMRDYISHNAYTVEDGSSSSSSRSEDGWWDGSGSESGSSCSSSYCSRSHSDDSIVEWESEVSPTGELFYVESLKSTGNPSSRNVLLESSSLNRDAEESNAHHRKRHSARGKLARLIKRRNSKRFRSKKCNKFTEPQQLVPTCTEVPGFKPASSNKVTFQDWQEGEVREVILSVDPNAKHNLGRRATLSETLLGIITSTFGDESRIMVAGFIPNGEAIKHRSIKIGDWLRSVDGQEITAQNIDEVLSAIHTSGRVKLKLQRVAGCDVASQLSSTNTPCHSSLVEQMLNHSTSEQLLPFLLEQRTAVVYLTQDGVVEGGPEDQGIIYCYPKPFNQNTLATARGIFVTLNHLLPEISPSPPQSSTIVLGGVLTHVIYTPHGTELLLFAIPDSRCSLQEAEQISVDVVRNLQFLYQTLSRAFNRSEHHPALDHFFAMFFSRLLKSNCIQDTAQLSMMFEDLMPASHWIPLPSQVQVQIDEVLNELEANEFADMGCDLEDYQRLYTIIGTSLYHKGYLLASHLPRADQLDVQAFCRQQGLLHLNHTEPVRSLIIWREVYPASCSRGLLKESGPYQCPQGRWFLLIVGQEHEMLVVLLEAGGCTMRPDNFPGPDICYVEEAQDILSYFQKIGISSVADKWLCASLRPEVTTPEILQSNKTPRKSENFLAFVRQSESPPFTKHPQTMSGGSASSGSPVSKKVPEITSILKRRCSPDRTLVCTPSGYSTSEDSASQAASVVSEVSDEAAPILGRRAERERGSHRSSDTTTSRLTDSLSEQSDNSDSDWEAFRNQSNRTYDLSEISRSLITDVEELLPTKLTAGEENVLFHYVHLDLTEGILLCPPISKKHLQSSRLKEILENFRQSSQAIHSVLQNTVAFKRLGQEASKSALNKSLIAIKEYGILFECSVNDGETNRKTQPSLSYWVVGRLFFTPHPREVYVCYHEDAPQNMVEIAFRLALSAAG